MYIYIYSKASLNMYIYVYIHNIRGETSHALHSASSPANHLLAQHWRIGEFPALRISCTASGCLVSG